MRRQLTAWPSVREGAGSRVNKRTGERAQKLPLLSGHSRQLLRCGDRVRFVTALVDPARARGTESHENENILPTRLSRRENAPVLSGDGDSNLTKVRITSRPDFFGQ